jgi:hypothetical protein
MIRRLLRFFRTVTREPSQTEMAAAALMMRDAARQENDAPSPQPKPIGLRKVLAGLE